MIYIEETTSNEIVIEKSRFIGTLVPVTDILSIESSLETIRKTHRDASHHCYAYIIRDGLEVKASDDGEPSRTAGIPILEVLKAHNLTDVLLVVTRYFGGIKLGAPGLTRAYRETSAALVKASKMVEKAYLPLIQMVLSYDKYDTIIYQMKDLWLIKDTQFLENIQITAVLKNLTTPELRILYHDIKIIDLGQVLSKLE